MKATTIFVDLVFVCFISIGMLLICPVEFWGLGFLFIVAMVELLLLLQLVDSVMEDRKENKNGNGR